MNRIALDPAKLRAAREKAKLTQEDVAKVLGLENRTSVSHYELGRQTPDGKQLADLANLYRVSVSNFFSKSA